MKISFRQILTVAFLGTLGCQKPETRILVESPLGWELMETPTEASLRGLSPLTDEIVWVSGSGGLWMRTLDGGMTWTSGKIDDLDTVDFRDIEGFDASTAIALSAGQPAVIYKTVDGGQTWNKKFQGPVEAFFDGMAFYKNKGYVIGDPVKGKWMILKTTDQGETWTYLETSPEAIEGEAVFAASGSSILVEDLNIWFASGGSNSKVYRSSDSGVFWQVTLTPIIQGEASQGIFSLVKLDDNNLIGVGGDYLKADHNENNIVLTADSGLTWKSIDGKHPSGYRSGVAYFSKLHWLISVGSNGNDFSRDGGIHWEKFSEEPFHAVVVDKTKTSVWAAGPDGKIGKLRY